MAEDDNEQSTDGKTPSVMPGHSVVTASGIPALPRVAVLCRWLPCRHQMLFAIANEVIAAHSFQFRPQQRPVFRIMIAQKRLVQATLFQTSGDNNRLAATTDFAQGIFSGMIHGRGQRHW